MVLGVEATMLLPLHPVLPQVPMPALAAAETIFVGEAGAASTAQVPALHWFVGAVPVVPFSPAKLAPVLLSMIVPAASVAPPATYAGPESVPHVAIGQ